MPEYRYLQLNKSNFDFFAALLRGPCMTAWASSNIEFGQKIVDSFLTTERYPTRYCHQASSVRWCEYPSWLNDEPRWEDRHLGHYLHIGGFFRFEMQSNKVISTSWLGYRVNVGELPLQIVGKMVSSNELRLVLEGVECPETRSSIIEDWKNLISEDFLAKYYN
jgi:hypothetical protein